VIDCGRSAFSWAAVKAAGTPEDDVATISTLWSGAVARLNPHEERPEREFSFPAATFTPSADSTSAWVTRPHAGRSGWSFGRGMVGLVTDGVVFSLPLPAPASFDPPPQPASNAELRARAMVPAAAALDRCRPRPFNG
jgi:hypothetical protein